MVRFVQNLRSLAEYTIFQGFEVRLYNAVTRPDIGYGRMRVAQGEPIGKRLDCENSPDSVFMEVFFSKEPKSF